MLYCYSTHYDRFSGELLLFQTVPHFCFLVVVFFFLFLDVHNTSDRSSIVRKKMGKECVRDVQALTPFAKLVNRGVK